MNVMKTQGVPESARPSLSSIAVVTGAAGFIGRHVAAALHALGYTVYALGHGTWPERDLQKWGVSRWLQAEITPSALVELVANERPACYLHCAGSGSVSASYKQPLVDFERNTATTAVLLDHVRQHNPQGARIVITSSAAVYGEHMGESLTEASTRSPVSPYGAHKLSAEMLCESYSRCFGLNVSIVRPFSVYGEGLRKQLLWDALEKFRRDEPVFFGTGDELRDWIHVTDIAALLCAAATRPQERFEVYNAGGETASIRKTLGLLAEKWGMPAERIRFSGEVHSGNPRQLTADSSRARTRLNWQPRVGLEEGLARYVAWYGESSRP